MLLDSIKRAKAMQDALNQAIDEMVAEFEAENRKLTDEEYNYLYWETDFKTNLFIDKKQINAMTVNPIEIEVTCSRCGETTKHMIKSRSERNKRFDLFICPECKQIEKEEQKKRNAEERQKYEEEHKQRQEKLKRLKTMPYADYLKSDHWQQTRLSALKRAKHKCQLCNSTGKLHVHHNNYNNRGCERVSDLIVLCETCHAKQHDKVANNER